MPSFLLFLSAHFFFNGSDTFGLLTCEGAILVDVKMKQTLQFQYRQAKPMASMKWFVKPIWKPKFADIQFVLFMHVGNHYFSVYQ